MPIKNLLKHRRISQWIVNSINNGHFKPGDKLPSEHALSKQFDTSRQTVRHATEELVQRGLLSRQRGSGTYVCGNAYQTGFSPKRVGVITTYLDDYIFPGIIRGIEDVLTEHGYTISLGITHNRHTDETTCLQRILEDNVCGLIVEGTKSSLPSPNLPLFEALRSRGIPMVFLNGYYREFSQCGVFQDDVTAARMLTEHLLENGHQRFAAVFKADDLQGLKRFEGMSLALTAANIPVDDQRILWYTTEDMQDLFSGEMDSFVLKRFGDATALICYNDQIGAMVSDLLKRQLLMHWKRLESIFRRIFPLSASTTLRWLQIWPMVLPLPCILPPKSEMQPPNYYCGVSAILPTVNTSVLNLRFVIGPPSGISRTWNNTLL